MADEEFLEEIIERETETNSTRPLMYVGPNIPKLGLAKYTVYKDGLTSEIEAAIDKIPEIYNMIINVDELINFTRNILNPSSPERQYHKIIQEKMKNL